MEDEDGFSLLTCSEDATAENNQSGPVLEDEDGFSLLRCSEDATAENNQPGPRHMNNHQSMTDKLPSHQ